MSNFSRKAQVYDRRPHHLDALRQSLGIHDWAVQTVYNEFPAVVKYYIELCVPIKIVRIGRSDPELITPYIKSLLNKRNKLRKQRKCLLLADNLATKINGAIAYNVRNQLSKLVDDRRPHHLYLPELLDVPKIMHTSTMIGPVTFYTTSSTSMPFLLVSLMIRRIRHTAMFFHGKW